MRFAILSDIHGNGDALDAVLDSAKQKNIDEFIVAGDIVTDFCNDAYVIEKIRQLAKYVIMGNREEYLLKWDDNIKEKNINKYEQYSSIRCAYESLNIEECEYIKNLPEQLEIKVNDYYSIRVCHGSPFSMYDLVYENETDDLIKKSFKSIEQNILICGHTHYPFYKWMDKKLVINAGSVGVHYHNKLIQTGYYILDINGKDINIEFINVKYDFDLLQEKLRGTDVYKNSPIWIDLSIESIKRGEDLNLDFVKTAIDISKNKGKFNNGLVDNDTWNELYLEWKKIGKV